jgi:hypothetical protein
MNTKTQYNKSHTMIIPDIHGKFNYMVKLFDHAIENNFHVVQLGDLIDAYDDTITRDMEMQCLELAQYYEKEHQFEFIFGNHELSYLFPSTMKASRFARGTKYVRDFGRLIVNIPFKTHVYIPFFAENESILITHAGLSMKHAYDNGLIEKEKGYTIDKVKLSDYLTNDHTKEHYNAYNLPPMYDIGIVRGGYSSSGGIFWNDYIFEFSAIYNLRQIFGHTRLGGVQISKWMGCAYNIDTLNSDLSNGGYVAIIDNDTGTIEIKNLKELGIEI